MLVFALFSFSPLAIATNLGDLLAPVTSRFNQAKAPPDGADLVTLEPGETEMYPRISADGKQILVVASKGKRNWISRRIVKNGDPVNIVTEDQNAMTSFGWRGNTKVYFLSSRSVGPGLWERAADGQGMIRQILETHGKLVQATLLADGSIIAVRLAPVRAMAAQRPHRKKSKITFENWKSSGYQSQIVHISPNGTEKTLSAGMNPALSPDGKRIVFSLREGRSIHLFMMQKDGTGKAQLTDARSIDVQPTWSPDGKWIAFTSNRAGANMRHPRKGSWDIWSIDSEGRNLTQLTTDKNRDGAPVVSPDGYVYFHSNRKIDRGMREFHQVRGSTGGFHIWKVRLQQKNRSLPKA